MLPAGLATGWLDGSLGPEIMGKDLRAEIMLIPATWTVNRIRQYRRVLLFFRV
jgi:hypothetical protein